MPENRSSRISSLLAASFLAALSAAWGFASGGEEGKIDFVRDVRPIFAEHCYDCHGPDRQKSGLRLDARPAAFRGGDYHRPTIQPGEADRSALVRFVRGEVEDLRMPPKGAPLSAAEIDVLTRWIEEGAVWPEGVDEVELDDPRDHWSFHPVRRPDPPAVKREGWPRNGIDRFILRRLEEKGLDPSPETGRAAWLRRVTLDLTGLPPTPEEVDAFLADESETAFATVVDRLLDSPRYGERWAQHWLDVVRYADTHGFEVNTERPHAWPYRDYVIEAFNGGIPYDRFIREQIAGDSLGKGEATGFLVTSAVLLPGQIGKDDASKRLARQDELGEMLINAGEAFLGLSIGCARCHDHKFDPISTEDYYSLQAFFSGVLFGDRPVKSPGSEAEFRRLKTELARVETELQTWVPDAAPGGNRPAVNARQNTDRFEPVRTGKVRFVILDTNRLEPCVDELEIFDRSGTNVARASLGARVAASGSRVSPDRHELRFVNDGEYGNSRSWMSNETGKGWVEVTFDRDHEIDRVVWGRDRTGRFKDRLATAYRVEVEGASGEWITVADSSGRRPHDSGKDGEEIDLDKLSAADRKEARRVLAAKKTLEKELTGYKDGGRLVYAGKFKEPEAIHVLYRGDPEQPKDEVAPRVPESLGKLEVDRESSDRERRLALANWIAGPDHPLTARVMVNRIWNWHFGKGIVNTPNDFGNSGEAPSHPELLDWLAAEFVRTGWSVKRLHRLIVLSATYRQASRVRPEGVAVDAGDRLLWRFPSRRIEAEAIRDSMLAISGRLNPERGGPGFNLFAKRGGLSGFPPVEKFDEEGRRRMIYAHRVRMEREAVFGAFDCPDAGQSAPRRNQSTTPLQALNLFNSPFTLDEARALADRLHREAGDDPSDQIRLAWRLLFSRDPGPGEIEEARRLVGEHGAVTLGRALFNTSEFLFLP